MTSLRVGGSVTVGDLLLGLVALIAALLLLLRPRIPIKSRWIWAGGGLLALSMLLVQVFPPASVEAVTETFSAFAYGSSLPAGMRLLVALLVLPVAISIVVSRWAAIPLLANAFVFGVAISSSVALLDAYLGTSIAVNLAANPDQVTGFAAGLPARFVGLTGHPNLLATTIVLAYPLVLSRMTSVRGLLSRLPVALLFLIALLLTGSRAGLLGTFLVVVLSLALNPRIRSVVLSLKPRVLTAYAVAMAVAVVMIFAIPVKTEPLPGAPATASVTGSIAGLDRINPDARSSQASDSIRRKYLEDSVDFIVDRPLLGYGFQWIETSHNIYLQLLLSGGVLALIGYLLVMFGYLREATWLRPRLSGSRLDLLIALAVSLLGYLLVMGMLTPDLLDRYLYLSAGLLLSMAALVRAVQDPDVADGS